MPSWLRLASINTSRTSVRRTTPTASAGSLYRPASTSACSSSATSRASPPSEASPGAVPTTSPPDHSSLTKIRDRLPLAVHEQVLTFMLQIAHEKKLLRGKTVAPSMPPHWKPTPPCGASSARIAASGCLPFGEAVGISEQRNFAPGLCPDRDVLVYANLASFQRAASDTLLLVRKSALRLTGSSHRHAASAPRSWRTSSGSEAPNFFRN